MADETCTKCGRKIGTDEQAYLFESKVFCEECNPISDSDTSNRAIWIMWIVVAAGLAGFIGFFCGSLLTRPDREKVKAQIDKVVAEADERVAVIKKYLVVSTNALKEANEAIRKGTDAIEKGNLENESLREKIYTLGNRLRWLYQEKPKFNTVTLYRATVPFAVYALVYERDIAGLDQSVSVPYGPTEYVEKNARLRIKDTKYCVRTGSWWIHVEGSVYANSQSDYFEGWINYNVFMDAPLIEIK